MDSIFLFLIFFILIFMAVPIGYAIGIATFAAMLLFSNIPLAMIAQNAVTGVDSFPLMAIPFFILAGGLMSVGGGCKADRRCSKPGLWPLYRGTWSRNNSGFHVLCSDLRICDGHSIFHRWIYDSGYGRTWL